MIISAPLHIQQMFKRLGFSANEVKVLLCLFQKKQANAKTISKLTLISFSSVEYVLQTMVKRNLATSRHAEEGALYIACSDADFKAWLDGERNRINTMYNEAEEEMKIFLHDTHEQNWKPEVTYYEGVEGIKEIYDDILKEEKEIYCFTDVVKMGNILGDEFLKDIVEKRKKKQASLFAIEPLFLKDIVEKRKNKFTQVRLVDIKPINGEIRIYGNKVAVITFDDEKPVGFLFEGKIIADLFKVFFKSYWNLCPEH